MCKLFFLCVYASAVSGDPGESFTVTGVVGSEGDVCFSLLRSGGILISFSLSASCEGLRPSLGLCLCVREREEGGGGALSDGKTKQEDGEKELK